MSRMKAKPKEGESCDCKHQKQKQQKEIKAVEESSTNDLLVRRKQYNFYNHRAMTPACSALFCW
jgi:hypothetical protein